MTTQRTFTQEAEMTATALVEREIATPDIHPMLAQLIASGSVSADDLGKFFDMQRQWEQDNARRAYAAAMLAAQGEMRPVVRGRTNEQQRSKYAALEDIHDVIKPIWLKHGFTLSYGSDQSPYPEHYRVTCDCLHEGGHVTHHVLDGPGDEKGLKGNPNKTPIQALTSTVTYLRRSLAVMIFDVTLVGADNDGQRDVTPITDEQLNELDDLMRQIVDKFGESERGRFYKYMGGVAKLSEIPASRFNDAKSAMQSKLRGK